jgi:hypothetical protein
MAAARPSSGFSEDGPHTCAHVCQIRLCISSKGTPPDRHAVHVESHTSSVCWEPHKRKQAAAETPLTQGLLIMLMPIQGARVS